MKALTLMIAQATGAEVPPAPEYIPGSYFFPVQASTFAPDIDFMYYAIFWICTAFFVVIIGLMAYFAVKYRRRDPHEVAQRSTDHNLLLEIAWSGFPSLLLIWMFIVGTDGFFKQRIPSDAGETIRVKAQRYNWQFVYPDGDISNELHLVMGQPTTFIMESADVLHAFFVPAFRQKQDIVPGRYTSCWVNPTLPGTFRLYCAEYCGDDHSNMRTNCTVHRTEEDRKNATKWDWPTKTPEENGQRLFSIYCSGCHSVTGQVKTGPALDHKFGTEEQVRAGGSLQTVTVDENYVRTSLEEPNRHIVDTFPSPSPMQSFKGQLTDDQIAWLIAYLKSLNP